MTVSTVRNLIVLMCLTMVGLIMVKLPVAKAFTGDCNNQQNSCLNGADARYSTCFSDCLGDTTCQGDCAGQRDATKQTCRSQFSSCIQGEASACRAGNGGIGLGCPGAGNNQICQFDSGSETCSCYCLCSGAVPTCPAPTCDTSGWGCNSPILLDVQGEGFHLTGAKDGVFFDIWARNAVRRFSWTDPKFHNGWLALDRNHNGKIDDGKELFGSVTQQPPLSGNEVANGFRALAVYDKSENGGNQNGFLDSGDAIYDSLLVWIDSNHDGFSQPSELKSLRASGVKRLDLNYAETPQKDAYGNLFYYKARIWDEADNPAGRFAWDVFLVKDLR